MYTPLTRALQLGRKACGLALLVSCFAGAAHAHSCVPEIDAGSLGSALAILTAGVLMLTDRLGARKR